MRPTLVLKNGHGPEGWLWQFKLNEERGVLTREGLLNRRGDHLAPFKLAMFGAAVSEVQRLFPSKVVDLGLLGYRQIADWSSFRGSVVVFDLPEVNERYDRRRALWQHLQVLPIEPPKQVALVYRLSDMPDPAEAFRLSKTMPGIEGIVGRDPSAFYHWGNSRAMAKCKWRD